MFFIWIRWKEKSQSTFENMKIWDFICLIQIMRIRHIFWFKSIWTEANKSFSYYLIQIIFNTWFESHFYGPPLVSLIRITLYTWFETCSFSAFFSWLCLIWLELIFRHDLNHEVFDSNHTLHMVWINWKMSQKSNFHLLHFTCSFDSKLIFLWFESNHHFSVFLVLNLKHI